MQTYTNTSIFKRPAKHYVLAAVFAIAAGLPSANATLLFSEDFNYNLGDLIGQGSWNGYGNGTGTVATPTLTPFSAGGLEVPSIGNEAIISDKTLFKALPSATPHNKGNTLFVSLVSKIDGNQYGGLRLRNSVTGRQLLIGQTWADANWGMTVDAGGGSTSSAASSVANSNTSMLLVQITYLTESTADIYLYVNPTVVSTSGAASISSATSAVLKNVALSEFNEVILLGTGSTFTLDAIKIGTALEDVVILSNIPEASTYATFLSAAIFTLVVAVFRYRSAK